MLADLVDLVLPRYCLGCGAGGAAVCADCLAVRPVVRHVPGVGAVHAAASYGGAVSTAIIHFKDRQRRDLRAVLADLLAGAVGAALADLRATYGRAGATGARPAGRPLLVPVPSTARAARARGGDHMRRLSTSAAARHHLRSAPLLSVGRAIADAAGLDARARRANIAGAYVCRPAPCGRTTSNLTRGSPAVPSTVIVVDDVVTTGSSLIEAVRSLRAAGWPVQGAAVIAAVGLTPGATPGRRHAGGHADEPVFRG